MPFTILVIDDEPPIRQGIAAIIKKEIPSATVLAEASNGKEGYELYLRVKPDLIISDIVMPVATGLELLQKIRTLDNDTPVILVSGYDEFSFAKEAIALQVTNYILKPISRTELVSSIASVMRRKHQSATISMPDIEALRSGAQTLFIQHLLTGQIETKTEVESTIQTLGLEIPTTTITVITLAWRSVDGDRPLQELAATLTGKPVLAVVPYQSYQVALVQGDERQAHRLAASLFAKSQEQVDQLLVGIGRQADGLLLAGTSFQQSLEALSYFPYHPDRAIFDYHDIDETPPSITTADIDLASLKELLFRGDDGEVERWVDHFFALLTNGKKPPLRYIKGMCIFLLSDIQKHLVQSHHVNSDHLTDAQHVMNGQHLTIETMRQRVLEMLMEIKHEAIPRSWVDNDTIIHQAKRHVELHIGSIISAVEISERLGLSASYFSTYFRTKTGETFTNYLNQKKDEYAKYLLSDFELTIEEVSQALGYTDYRSFHRIFKKKNDMTPSDYRKLVKRQCGKPTE